MLCVMEGRMLRFQWQAFPAVQVPVILKEVPYYNVSKYIVANSITRPNPLYKGPKERKKEIIGGSDVRR